MSKITIDLKKLTADMDELKQYKSKLEFELNNTKKQIEKIELQLIALLDQTDVNSMIYGVYDFGLKIVQKTALDQKLLKQKYPEQYQDCYLTKENKKFYFKTNK